MKLKLKLNDKYFDTNLAWISGLSDCFLQEFWHFLILITFILIDNLIYISFVEDSWSPIVNLLHRNEYKLITNAMILTHNFSSSKYETNLI